jgi:hypothetical protein
MSDNNITDAVENASFAKGFIYPEVSARRGCSCNVGSCCVIIIRNLNVGTVVRAKEYGKVTAILNEAVSNTLKKNDFVGAAKILKGTSSGKRGICG